MVSSQLGKFLVIAGVILVVAGLLLMAGPKFSSLGLGLLPGDIAYKGKSWQFYFPIVTCLVLSVVLTLVFWIISHFTRR
jgi:membrane protein implicated in regulation of membrane protease activity